MPLAPPQTPPPPPEVAVAETHGPEALERILNSVLRHTSDLPGRIAAYMVEHYASNMTREEMASAMQVSDDYVSRIFRKETGMTPWQFLNRYRILQAQKLLLTTQHNITEVGALVGLTIRPILCVFFTAKPANRPSSTAKVQNSTELCNSMPDFSKTSVQLTATLEDSFQMLHIGYFIFTDLHARLLKPYALARCAAWYDPRLWDRGCACRRPKSR